MTIPALKIFLTLLKIGMKPVNTQISKKLKDLGKEHVFYRSFVWFGNECNEFEIRLNRRVLGIKGLGEIPPLHREVAFAKGVDYFTDLFFVYGLLTAIAMYEIMKGHKSSVKQAETIKRLENFHKDSEPKLQKLQDELNQAESQRRLLWDALQSAKDEAV